MGPRSPGNMPLESPVLVLAYSGNRYVYIQPDPGSPSDVVVSLPKSLEVLHAPGLAAIFTRPYEFSQVTPLAVRAAGQDLVAAGAGYAGSNVTLLLIPVLSKSGPLLGAPFTLAKVLTHDGRFMWQGPVVLPPGYRTFFPIKGWEVKVREGAVKDLPSWTFINGPVQMSATLPLSLARPASRQAR